MTDFANELAASQARRKNEQRMRSRQERKDVPRPKIAKSNKLTTKKSKTKYETIINNKSLNEWFKDDGND